MGSLFQFCNPYSRLPFGLWFLISLGHAIQHVYDFTLFHHPISLPIISSQIVPIMKNSIKVERAKKNITQALGKFVPSTVLALRMAHIFEVEVSAFFELEESDWE